MSEIEEKMGRVGHGTQGKLLNKTIMADFIFTKSCQKYFAQLEKGIDDRMKENKFTNSEDKHSPENTELKKRDDECISGACRKIEDSTNETAFHSMQSSEPDPGRLVNSIQVMSIQNETSGFEPMPDMETECQTVRAVVADTRVEDKECHSENQIMGCANNDSLIISVDAIPTRGGGLLRLPGQERTIYYYSVNWMSHFEFPNEASKFEMVNAAIALEAFEPYVLAYRARYKNFIVKTDSHFFQSVHGFKKDPYDFEFLHSVLTKTKLLEGTFQHVTVSGNDTDIKNADYLSRMEIPTKLKFEYSGDHSYVCKMCGSSGTNWYALVDISKTVEHNILDVVRDTVPGRYLKGYKYG